MSGTVVGDRETEKRDLVAASDPRIQIREARFWKMGDVYPLGADLPLKSF